MTEQPTSFQLEGRVAVVTGASRGIGFAIAEALASRRCAVVITARHLSSLEEAAGKLAVHGGRSAPFECDVRDESDVQRLFSFVGEEFGHLDFLINNAGVYGPAQPIGRTDVGGFRDAVGTNLVGTFLCTRYGLPLMKAGSVIVNNLSVAAYHVFPNSAAYTASKQGALGLTNATREDLRQQGIRVMALVPGATDTEMWNQFWPQAPRHKMVPPSEVAEAVVATLMLSPGTSVDEIRIGPSSGAV
jgi:NAD(P)-dependent dehydrogenase (short-subunit alcohol dehydrogenase family)